MIGDKTCAQCGDFFVPFKDWQIYCCEDCNKAAYYLRKIKMKKRGIDAILDLDNPGPSEAQQQDRERRVEISEAKAQGEHTKKVMEAMERTEKVEEILSKDDSRRAFEELYSPHKETRNDIPASKDEGRDQGDDPKQT